MLSKRAIINEVIKEWSWQVPSGMPDATNPEHLEILRSVLSEEFNISKYETDQFIFLLQEKRTYKDNPQNRALNRVGQPWGTKGTPSTGTEDKPEEEPTEEPEGFTDEAPEGSPSEATIQKDAKKKIAAVEAQIPGTLDKEQEAAARKLIEKLKEWAEAKTNAERIAIMKELGTPPPDGLGLIKRNDRGTDTKKFYVDPSTGLDYKAFGEKSSLHKAMMAYDEAEDPPILDTLKQANMGGKKTSPMKALLQDKRKTIPDPDNPGEEMDNPRFGKVRTRKAKVERITDDKGNTTAVKIDGKTYKKVPDPNGDSDESKALKKKLQENLHPAPRFSEVYENDPSGYKRALAAIKRHNALIDKVDQVLVEGGSLEVIDPLPGTKPDSPENCKKIKNAASQQLRDKIEELFPKPLTKAHKKILAKFDKLQGLDGEEYEKAMLELMGDLNKHPDSSSGWADMVETFSYLRALNNNKAAYLPSAGNFPLGDLVAISDEEIDPENDTPEEIASKIQAIQLGIENRSIKKESGGASSSSKKVDLTEFSGTTDPDGNEITGEEVKEDCEAMTTTGYDAIFNNDPADPALKNEEQAIQDRAKKYGVDINSDKYKEKRTKAVNTAINTINKERAKQKPPNNKPLTPKEEKLMRRKLDALHDQGTVFEKVYNENGTGEGATQLYTNESWSYNEKTGEVERDATDGDCKQCEVKFAFNVGFNHLGTPGNKMPTRFHNVDKCAVAEGII